MPVMTIGRQLIMWTIGGGVAGAVIAAGADLLYYYVIRTNDVVMGLCLGMVIGAGWTLVDWLEKPH
jgi:hypothetical protein